MSRKICLCSLLGLGVFAIHSTAHADLLAITTDFGITATRDHSNLAPDVNEVTFGDGVDVRAKINSLNELCYGTSINAAADIRQITNITNDCCGATFGPPPGTITAIGVAEGDHFALGGDNGAVFVRDRTDLGATAPGVTGDGTVFNTQVNAIARLSNGHLVIGNQNGEIFVRDKADITQVAPGASADGINFGIAITSLAVTTNDDVVIALSGGGIDTRPWTNVAASHSSVNFGIPGAAHAALRSDGNVALGFGNGTVTIRDPLNLTADLGNSVNFGNAITTLIVDKDDNFVIGRTSGHVNVRQAGNVTQVPAGFLGDDINFGLAILSLNLAASVAEPEFESIARGLTPDKVIIQWTSESGRQYTVEQNTSLGSGGYGVVTSGLSSTPPSNVYTADASAASAAYRVISDPE